METKELKRAVEALLLVADGPLGVEQVREVISGAGPSEIREAFFAIARECDEGLRGFRLKEIAGGFQWVTDPSLGELVKLFLRMRESRRISQASLETLAIIAYKQPITRAEIEFIRGVNVEGALKTLLEKGLIQVSGRKEVPGRPLLYATTKPFLDHFGLASLKELPHLVEFSEKDIQLPKHLQREAGTPRVSPESQPNTVV